jgi:hypothetical protein
MASSAHSRTGYTITFANCPILWLSKLQSEIALSTTEAEYISLSQALRAIIPLQAMMQELHTIFKYSIAKIMTHSTVFEDNIGCVDLIAAPTMRPRTRHISIKYHHFCEHVRKGHIRIQWISMDKQLTDLFTKLLPAPKFILLRKQLLLGW